MFLIGRKPESGKVRSSFLRGTAELDRDRAKAREQEGVKQLPACTAKLERDRAKAREREQRKVEKKKRKQVITCELEWDMMFIN